MSQHAPDACNESDGMWLPLTEYSVRSGVSLSTIRRKIKSNSIPYRLENGRYLILFQEKGEDTMHNNHAMYATSRRGMLDPTARSTNPMPALGAESHPDTLPLVERSVSMVSDAFEHALKEKDERIRLLERRNAELAERLDELKLLVQVLEEKYNVRY